MCWRPVDVDVSLRGSVILAGHVEEEKVFRNAAELPVRGMILGSMAPSLVPLAMQMKYPILVIEGLGHRDMNIAAHKLLSTNAKRDVAINAEPFDRYTGTRPEVVIQLPVTQEPPLPRDLEYVCPRADRPLPAQSLPGRRGHAAKLCVPFPPFCRTD